MLVYDKSDQHNTAYDSYNIELGSKKKKTFTIENASNTYSIFNGVKLDTTDEYDRYLLHHQFVAWVCNGCSIAPRTDYVSNDVYKELPKHKDFFETSDEKLFIDLRRSKG